MSAQDMHVNLGEIVAPLAKAVDLMSPVLAEHHLRVAYLAFRLSERLGLPLEERRDIVLAAALHDIGAFSLNERIDLLEFEETKPTQHSEAGYLLLRGFAPLARAAELVRFHHVPWNGGAGQPGCDVPAGSHVIHLADRVAVLVTGDRPVLGQVEDICAAIVPRAGTAFAPEHVEAFLEIAKTDYLWMELVSGGIEVILNRAVLSEMETIDLPELLDFSRLLCRIIDFKSAFTATHSSGVAATSMALARWVGFSEFECKMLQVAAYLHDLGKLAIPSEILEKPGKLTPSEWQVMRTHAYYTYHVLEPIQALGMILSWGALHQERLNGTGYPFRYHESELPLGSRILAVADVFTGITENRPYREGMDKEAALAVLKDMAARHELDGTVVGILAQHFDEVNEIRTHAQDEATSEYQAFQASLQ